MKKIALIPAYEPDNKLIELLKKIVNEEIFAIVIDDGSGAKYKEIFEQAKKYAYIISYEINKGKGYALKTGLKYIKENFDSDYIVITMDSDGQHTVEDAKKLITYSEEHPEELVLGKRPRGNHTPLKSKIGNGLTRITYKLSTGVSIYDTQTGLRAFSNKLIDTMLNIEGSRYEYEMNVLLELPQLKIKIKEIEIQPIYFDNNSGTHFHPIKDSIRIYKQLICFSLSGIFSFLLDYILYSAFLKLFLNLTVANVLARIISATANYFLNKKLVFKSRVSLAKSIIEYALLAVIILVLNTISLNILVNILGLNAQIAKVIVEIVLFVFNWIIQKRVIFKKLH